MNTSGTITFTASVTDSRGRVSANATVTISVVAYSAPSFSKYISQRCNSAGTASDSGTYVKSTVNFSYASCSSKNTITTATYYRKTTETSWTNASKTFTSGTAFTFGGGNISAESSYEVKFKLTDAFTSIEVTDIVAHVHDEVIIEADPRMSLSAVCEQMARVPSWAEGLLLRADGYTCNFYKKD